MSKEESYYKEVRERHRDRIAKTTKKLKGPCGNCHLWFMNFDSEIEGLFCRKSCEDWKSLTTEDQQYNTEVINSFKW